MLNNFFNDLPEHEQMEVAQVLCHPPFSKFLANLSAYLHMSTTQFQTPSIADSTKCQQFVAEIHARREQAHIIEALVELGVSQLAKKD